MNGTRLLLVGCLLALPLSPVSALSPPVAAAVPPSDKLTKLDAALALAEVKLQAARVERAEAHVVLLLAEDEHEAAFTWPVTNLAEWKQRSALLKSTLKARKQAARRLAKRAKKLDKRTARRDLLIERLLDLDPDHFAPAEVPAVTAIPLIVQEALPAGVEGIDRHRAVATFGVPVGREQAVPVTHGRPALAVAGADVFQLRTLDTWPEGTARWVLCDVRTNVPAGQVVDGLSLVGGTGVSGGEFIGSESNNLILLDTGPLQTIIQKQRFGLFDWVVVDGKLIAYQPDTPGLRGTSVAGELLRPSADSSVILEENGPARAVVVAEGTLARPNGYPVLAYTCRITARSGRRDLEVTLTARNASLARPAHAVVDSIELGILARPGIDPRVTMTTHLGEHMVAMDDDDAAWLYQAYSTAPTSDVGSGNWKSHLPKLAGVSPLAFVHEGYELGAAGQVLHALGDRQQWPRHGGLRLAGLTGSVSVAIQKMPFLWPAALEVVDGRRVVAGIFSRRNPAGYTFAWRQHESRTALFAFHSGQAAAPAPTEVARWLDHPVTGRCADYRHYDRAGVFPYRLLDDAEHDHTLALMGIDHDAQGRNSQTHVTRYLYRGTGGGNNNHASIETALGGHWLRYGMGGAYINGLDLALYKSEWQISRSDDFNHRIDPGASNPGWPHSTGYASDDEHRYREGILLAYHLTGDARFRDALRDEAEVLDQVYLWPHERSMYLTLRAMAYVSEFANDPSLVERLRQRLAYVTEPTIDVEQVDGGWGWQDAPDAGDRRYFVNSTQNQNEMPPGEEFQARGFISASMGPLGFFHAARVLPPGDPLRAMARGRLRDLSWWSRHELFPTLPDIADQRLAYSYAVTLQQITEWENVDFHPILLGMAESYLDTGDEGYLAKGVEQLRAAHVHGDLHYWDVRLDVQHFLSVWRGWKLGQ